MTKFTKISLAVALSLGAVSANALTITYNTSTTPAVTALATTQADFSVSNGVTIPKFNLSGFTLSGVSLSFFGSANLNYTAGNGIGAPDATIVDPSTLSVREKFTGPGIVVAGLNVLPTTSITGGSDVTVLSGTTFSFTGSGSDQKLNQNPIGVNGATLATFIGAGTLGYNVAGLFLQSTTITGGSLVQNGQGFANATMTVTYTYDVTPPPPPPSVPEPATLGLMGLGFAGMALARRRKAAK